MSQCGKMSGAGDLGMGAAALKKCWVAREVYQDDRWLLFREWLETKAPTWLHDTYCQYGERVAEYIKDKPSIKRIIKFFMDKVI